MVVSLHGISLSNSARFSLFCTFILFYLLWFIEHAAGDKEPVLFFVYFIFYIPYSFVALVCRGVRWVRLGKWRYAVFEICFLILPYAVIVFLLAVRCWLECEVMRYLGVCSF